jgi:hypothetical protein
MIICFSPHFIELGENVWTNLISTRRALISGQQSAHHAISGGIGITRVSFLHFFTFTIWLKRSRKLRREKKKAIETSRTTFTTECGNTLWFRLGNYLWLSNHLLCRTKRLLFEMLIHDREKEKKRSKSLFFVLLTFLSFSHILQFRCSLFKMTRAFPAAPSRLDWHHLQIHSIVATFRCNLDTLISSIKRP